MTRNYDMKTVCNICNTPFVESEEGYHGDVGKVPAMICASCFTGMAEVIESNEPHTAIECPSCNHIIGLRLEVLDDT
jgi:hypothetical protein